MDMFVSCRLEENQHRSSHSTGFIGHTKPASVKTPIKGSYVVVDQASIPPADPSLFEKLKGFSKTVFSRFKDLSNNNSLPERSPPKQIPAKRNTLGSEDLQKQLRLAALKYEERYINQDEYKQLHRGMNVDKQFKVLYEKLKKQQYLQPHDKILLSHVEKLLSNQNPNWENELMGRTADENIEEAERLIAESAKAKAIDSGDNLHKDEPMFVSAMGSSTNGA